jgi:hypothetical protein
MTERLTRDLRRLADGRQQRRVGQPSGSSTLWFSVGVSRDAAELFGVDEFSGPDRS